MSNWRVTILSTATLPTSNGINVLEAGILIHTDWHLEDELFRRIAVSKDDTQGVSFAIIARAQHGATCVVATIVAYDEQLVLEQLRERLEASISKEGGAPDLASIVGLGPLIPARSHIFSRPTA